MRRGAAAFGLVAPIAVSFAGAPAQAKYPGTNGQVAFTRYDPLPGDAHVFVANPDGTKARQLLPIRRR